MRHLVRADRKTLLLGTALASTLLFGTLIAPPPAAAAVVTCAGDVGTGPTPINHTNNDDIVCLNTETRIGTLYAIYLHTNANGASIYLNSSGRLYALNGAGADAIATITDNPYSLITIINSNTIVANSTTSSATGIYSSTRGDPTSKAGWACA